MQISGETLKRLLRARFVLPFLLIALLLPMVGWTSGSHPMERDLAVEEQAASADEKYRDALEYRVLVYEQGLSPDGLLRKWHEKEASEAEQQMALKLNGLDAGIERWTEDPEDAVVVPEDQEAVMNLLAAELRAVPPYAGPHLLDEFAEIRTFFYNGNRCFVDALGYDHGPLMAGGVFLHLLKCKGGWLIIRRRDWIS